MSEERKPYISEDVVSQIEDGHGLGAKLRNLLSPYKTMISILQLYFDSKDDSDKQKQLSYLEETVSRGYYNDNLEEILSVLRYDDSVGNIYNEEGEIIIPNVGAILERERKKTLSKMRMWHYKIELEIREQVEKEFPKLSFVSSEYDMCHRTIFFYTGGREHDTIVIVVKEDGHIEVQNGSVHNGPYTTVRKVSDLKEAIAQYV